jgi:hypothetical protein
MYFVATSVLIGPESAFMHIGGYARGVADRPVAYRAAPLSISSGQAVQLASGGPELR